jgi:anthranilate phosphoribosyltransferase
MDELSTLGPNRVAEAAAGTVRTIDLTSPFPRPYSLHQLAGGTSTTNAEILESILRGETRGPRRDLVVLNAAAGLIVTGLAADLTGGVDMAEASLDSGRAATSLQEWRAFS